MAAVAAQVDGGATGRLAPRLRGLCVVAPELDRIGGYELATLALVRYLRSQSVPVSVVTTTTAVGNGDAMDGVTRIEVRARRTLLAIFPRLMAFLFTRRSGFSVIYCPTFSYMSGLAILAARLMRRPVIVRVATENDVHQFRAAGSGKDRLFYALLRRASVVIAPSAAIQAELREAGFEEHRIVVQPNAVDADHFRPVTAAERLDGRRRLGLPEDAITIGTVARLVARKGIDILLRAFASPVIQAHRARLLVVGSGPLATELAQLARDLAIEDAVVWAGLQRDPRPWLQAMDVFAFPSRLEGSPNAVLEAMASGLPIVASRIGGVVDLLAEEQTGVLVPADDPLALGLALGRLLDDASLRSALGSSARRDAVKALSIPTTAAKLTELCLALQSGSRST